MSLFDNISEEQKSLKLILKDTLVDLDNALNEVDILTKKRDSLMAEMNEVEQFLDAKEDILDVISKRNPGVLDEPVTEDVRQPGSIT